MYFKGLVECLVHNRYSINVNFFFIVLLLSTRKQAHKKIKWIMSSSEWHNWNIAEMKLKSIFGVRPRLFTVVIMYIYSLFFLLLMTWMTFTKCTLFLSLSFFSRYTFAAPLTGVRFRIWSWLVTWKTDLWFTIPVAGPADQPARIHEHVFPL